MNSKSTKLSKRFFVGNNDLQLKMKYSGIMRYVPLIIVGGFYLCTILLFAFGPLQWNISNHVKLYTFLFSCFIALVFGYIFAVHKGKTSSKKMDLNINRIVIVCSLIFFIMYIPTLVVTTGKWYPDIVTGIMETGKAYRLSKYYNEVNSPIILYIRMILSPFMIMVMPVTMFFMPKLNKLGKISGILVILMTICLSISQGTNKAVADFTSQIVLILFILLFSNTHKKSPKIYRFKIIVTIILVCVLFFAYYSNSMKNRVSTDIAMQENGTNSSNFDPSSVPKNKVSNKKLTESIESYSKFSVSKPKENYIFDKILPKNIRPLSTYLTSYLSHGYVGLSYALDKDFTSTYGLGFSDFFRHNVLKVFGKVDREKNVIAKTYQGKISENGWKTGEVWSTFFVFPASDISFPGTILLVLLIGYFWGLSWKDAIKTQNPFAIVSFFGFCTVIFYFSANNQMFQGGENFIGFTSMLICWWISRYKLSKNGIIRD